MLAGNLNYNFNEHFISAEASPHCPVYAVPRATFPFWLNVDNRLLTDEFMRPSYTSGVWAKGNITPALRYQVMVGNNLSTLGVSSAPARSQAQHVATALVWMPTTREFGHGIWRFRESRGARHATRGPLHAQHRRQAEPAQLGSFENTQIRLADGNVVFTPNLFGPALRSPTFATR